MFLLFLCLDMEYSDSFTISTRAWQGIKIRKEKLDINGGNHERDKSNHKVSEFR